MPNWQERLHGDALPWLLDPEDPCVRYWTLTDILDRPDRDPEVQETRAAINQQTLVQELFALQHSDGHWGDDETKPYTAQGAVAALALLHMHGVRPDQRTAAGCDSFLRFCQHESGGFSLTKTLRSGIFPCTTGEHLPFLVYSGPGGDARVRAALREKRPTLRERALRAGAHHRMTFRRLSHITRHTVAWRNVALPAANCSTITWTGPMCAKSSNWSVAAPSSRMAMVVSRSSAASPASIVTRQTPLAY